jgi:DNA-binding MarR family transcriptional regulator
MPTQSKKPTRADRPDRKTAVTPSPTACHAASRLGRSINRAIAQSSITPPDYRLLAHLATGGELAATELADKLVVSRPTITNSVDSLVSRGLVKKAGDPKDGRRVRISPTPLGLSALEEADQLVSTRVSEILEPLGTAAANNVIAALELLHDALDIDRRQRHSRYMDHN